MKTINIAPLGCRLYIYGPKEKAVYEKKINRLDDGDLGEVSGNIAWVSDIEHCQHEAIHLVDWIIEDHLLMAPQKLVSTAEFRAYLTEWITGQMESYVKKNAGEV
jgi:hypothetical protein